MKAATKRLVSRICSVPMADWWSLALVLSVACLLSAVVYRVHKLQSEPDPRLKEFMGDYVSSVKEPGRRGSIFDRRGRLIASSHFGKFLVVDPVEFPGKKYNRDEAIVALALALGENPGKLGAQLVKTMVRNDAVWTDAGVDLTSTKPRPSIKGLDRYEHVGPNVLADGQLEAVTALMTDRKKRMVGLYLEHRAVRDRVADDLIAPIVGSVGMENTTGKDTGKFGLEMRVQHKGIEATDGSLKYVRDAAGSPMWVLPDGYEPPNRGEDVVLAIDLEIQKIVAEELERGTAEADSAGGRCVMLDVQSGDIVAIMDTVRDVAVKDYDFKTFIPKPASGVKTSGTRWRVIKAPEAVRSSAETQRNRCIEDIYEPGSTFKPFMWSTVMELRRATIGEEIITGTSGWTAPDGRTLRDVTRRASMSVRDVLINSSNIGMVKLTQRLSPEEMRSAVVNFGFGTRTRIGLPGEAAGIVTTTKNWRTSTQVSNAIGHEVSVTPVQMVRAFAAFCREGDMAGTVTDVRLIASIGERPSMERTSRRVLSPEIAKLTRTTMQGVTHKVDERLATTFGETGWKYELFGKSGTAQIPITDRGDHPLIKGSSGYFTGQYFSSFIAGGPAINPRLAIIVIIDDPAPGLVLHEPPLYYGSLVAGPVARRIMERSLSYLGVPASPPSDQVTQAHGGD